ncbi:hypothetical protein [Kineococcus sp. SYSU DK003]|uniref:hypothetical protein n=1 Tax=Kineococcus sp. SYSU DK003 TaxID=3383124 RepID=UPI003D7EF508
MALGIFRSFNKEKSPLSYHLRQRFLRPAERQVEQIPLEELTDPGALAHRLAEQYRVQPPTLHGREAARDGDDGEPRPTGTAAVRLPTTRFYVAIQVTGEVELLEWWPDTLGANLSPVDHGLGEWISPAPGTPFDAAEALRRHRALLAQDLWTIGRRSDPGPLALYTFLDLTDDELDELATNGRDLSAEVDESLMVIKPIVEAIAAQTRAFFDTEMPRHLQQLIEARRRHLQGRRRAVRSLIWPTGWKYDSPALTALPGTPTPSPEAGANTHPMLIPRSTPAGQSGPDFEQQSRADEAAHTLIDESASVDDTLVRGVAVRDVALGLPARLADASFTDLLRTIRVWADAVHRHPTAYVRLAEERISDLLAATLNAALPGAQREVYSRSGKTDLYVRADVLATGAAPAKVFICECKRWSGPSQVAGDLDQLLGYLDGTDTAAVLLYIVDRTRPHLVHEAAAAKLRERPEYRNDEESIVDGWPLLNLQTPTGRVRLCLVFLDLPATRSAADHKARRQ